MSEILLNLGEYDGEALLVPAPAVLTGRSAVIGMSGSGKSHLLGVLCEELCAANLSFVVLDPEGEYQSLKEKYEVVWASRRTGADVKLKVDACKGLAQAVAEKGGRLILDTSDSDDELAIASAFLSQLYEVASEVKRPLAVIVEEADRFVPQSSGNGVPELLEISRRGRKRGIGLLIATQRPAMVDKNVLSQCANQLVGKLRSQNDLAAVKLFFENNERLRSLAELERGQFYAMGDFVKSSKLFMARGRHTTHQGRTPELGEAQSFNVDDFVTDIQAGDGGPASEATEALRPAREQAAPKTETAEEVELSESELVEKATQPASAKRAKAPKAAPVLEEEDEEGELEEETLPQVTTREKAAVIARLEFSLTEAAARDLAERHVSKTLFSSQPKESVESFDAVYWPILHCHLQTSRRGFFGLKVVRVDSAWDGVFSTVLRFDGVDAKEVAHFEPRLIGLSQDHLRILDELRSSDLSAQDLASRTGIELSTTRSAVLRLRKRKLIVTAGRAGRAHLYRPIVAIEKLSLSDLDTKIPGYDRGAPRPGAKVLDMRVREENIASLVQGLIDNAQVISSHALHLPFYLCRLRHKSKQTLRGVLIHGITGSVRKLTAEQLAQLKV
ncbi:MAG: DUF87 domain-containing protein [Myxococcota bacterium]|jgi:hypothetical protein|nr:DUF87 domain-containing protein [Myxococcota bacterium]